MEQETISVNDTVNLIYRNYVLSFGKDGKKVAYHNITFLS